MMQFIFWIACGLILLTGKGQPAVVSRQQTSAAIEVRPIDANTLNILLHRRNGRVLMLNVWATWCVPCVEEFPDLVRLDASHRTRGVDVVTLSIDYEDEIESKVKPFLRRMKAGMPAYVNAFAKQEDFITALSAEWSGAIPATFVFDSSGSLRETLVGKQSFKSFVTAAEKVLRKRK